MARLWSTASSALAVLAVLVALVSSKSTINRQVVKPLSAFGARLFRELCEQAGKDNVVVSPISAHMALSMLLLGADEGSETEREIKQALGCGDTDECLLDEHHQAYRGIMDEFKTVTEDGTDGKKLPVINLFNILVTKNQASLNRTYQREVKRYYDATATNIYDRKPQTKRDLLRRINNWAKEAGFGKRPLTEKDLDSDFAAMILSAIDVKALWFQQMDEVVDVFRNFYNYGLVDSRIWSRLVGSFRTGKYRIFNNTKTKADFRVVKLPLRNKLTLTIFEPQTPPRKPAKTREALIPNRELDKLLRYLLADADDDGSSNLDRCLEVLDRQTEESYFDFSMPKFRLERKLNLVESLRALGIERALSRAAELNGIVTAPSGMGATSVPLHVSSVRQSAMIEATKDGIQAAAKTIIHGVFASNIQPVRIHVEQPFIFLFRYEDIPLFIGRLTHRETPWPNPYPTAEPN